MPLQMIVLFLYSRHTFVTQHTHWFRIRQSW